MSNSDHISRRVVLGSAAGIAGGLAAVPLTFGDEPSAGTSKGRINQSISEWCYGGKLSLEALCQNAVRIGFKAIDLVGPKQWPVVKKHNLVASMCPGSGSIGKGWNRKENHAAQIEEMKKNIDLTADAGMPNVICFSGNSAGQPDEEGIKICIEGLKQVVGHAEKRGINICMEYLNSKVDHKDYAFDNMAYGVGIAKGVGSERFGILYDIYHAQIMEGDIIRTIGDYHPYIRHYHTGGNPGRNEIDDTQELNYTPIMKAIVKTGFKGYVAHEFVPKGDPVKGLEYAFRVCDV